MLPAAEALALVQAERDRYWLNAKHEVYKGALELVAQHQTALLRGLRADEILRGDPRRREIAALVKAGATVQVVMTEAAEAFITAVTLQALSGRPVYTSQWDARPDNNMAHIALSREADAILVAPASADFIARLAQGRADDLLALMCLARPIERVPLLVAPAMNREMWAHPATLRNVQQLRADGAVVLGPDVGEQACLEFGEGRMLEAADCATSSSPSSRRSCCAASACW